MRFKPLAETIEYEYAGGVTCKFTPVIECDSEGKAWPGAVVGYVMEKDGRKTFAVLNPSTGGDGPDVFVYLNETGDPCDEGSVCFLAPLQEAREWEDLLDKTYGGLK